ncbi:MAG TPA: methylated-DNA--[protein]-cysteine S-methyltransferase, partial [Candidatus Elarobacter sp.]|nr:methylated-DNA--[protein]-cysteine S-methyltransferase [Candidatus Elarobacter sp.]
MTELLVDHVDSPIGSLLVVSDGTRLCALDFGDDDESALRAVQARYAGARLREQDDPAGISSRLRAYFDGDRTAIDAIDVEPGGTPFQRAVWTALRAIPSGTTRTYGDIAAQLGQPAATRAVGAANGRNPIAVVVPCHRLVGADASLI